MSDDTELEEFRRAMRSGWRTRLGEWAEVGGVFGKFGLGCAIEIGVFVLLVWGAVWLLQQGGCL